MFGQTTGKNILMQHFKEELSESLVNLISEFFPGHSPVQYPPVRISYRVKISSTCCLNDDISMSPLCIFLDLTGFPWERLFDFIFWLKIFLHFHLYRKFKSFIVRPVNWKRKNTFRKTWKSTGRMVHHQNRH